MEEVPSIPNRTKGMKKTDKIGWLYSQLRRQNDVLEALRRTKDDAYRERNKVVSALSKLFPAWLGKHESTDKTWHKEWMNIVFIKLPTGQVSWHLHDSDLAYFAHLEYKNEKWDGHTTEEKYERLLSLLP